MYKRQPVGKAACAAPLKARLTARASLLTRNMPYFDLVAILYPKKERSPACERGELQYSTAVNGSAEVSLNWASRSKENSQRRPNSLPFAARFFVSFASNSH